MAVIPPPPRAEPRLGVLLALVLAVVTAVAVLAAQLFTAGGGTLAYAAAALPATGPTVEAGQNPLYAIQEVLAGQSAALLRGDRDGYLRAIPAEQNELRELAGRRFDSLTALHVKRWTLTPDGIPSQLNGVWRVTVNVGYCFDAADCTPVPLRIGTGWAVARGRLQLVSYEQTTRPWDVSPLIARDGERVTVAGPAGDAAVTPALLERVVRIADAAARTDDRFAASFDGPPQRYHIYIAGDEQWKQWYTGNPANAAAYTIPLQPGASDVVVAERYITSDRWTSTLLTHELAHVVSVGGNPTPDSAWWLIEGMAEYAANTADDSVLTADLKDVRPYVAAGRWDGTVALGPPPAGTSLADTNARYGLALLAVAYLAGHYGEAKMLAFFIQVVLHDATLDAAARATLGTDWPSVAKAASAAMRTTATAS